MMVEELKMLKDEKSPVKASLATFAAFVGAGLIPLISYLLALQFPGLALKSFETSVILTALAMFSVGALRSVFIPKKWYLAGLEMLLVCGGTAVVSYGVGVALAGLA